MLETIVRVRGRVEEGIVLIDVNNSGVQDSQNTLQANFMSLFSNSVVLYCTIQHSVLTLHYWYDNMRAGTSNDADY